MSGNNLFTGGILLATVTANRLGNEYHCSCSTCFQTAESWDEEITLATDHELQHDSLWTIRGHHWLWSVTIQADSLIVPHSKQLRFWHSQCMVILSNSYYELLSPVQRNNFSLTGNKRVIIWHLHHTILHTMVANMSHSGLDEAKGNSQQSAFVQSPSQNPRDAITTTNICTVSNHNWIGRNGSHRMGCSGSCKKGKCVCYDWICSKWDHKATWSKNTLCPNWKNAKIQICLIQYNSTETCTILTTLVTIYLIKTIQKLYR